MPKDSTSTEQPAQSPVKTGIVGGVASFLSSLVSSPAPAPAPASMVAAPVPSAPLQSDEPSVSSVRGTESSSQAHSDEPLAPASSSSGVELASEVILPSNLASDSVSAVPAPASSSALSSAPELEPLPASVTGLPDGLGSVLDSLRDVSLDRLPAGSAPVPAPAPSGLADAFRSGWAAGVKAASEKPVAKNNSSPESSGFVSMVASSRGDSTTPPSAIRASSLADTVADAYSRGVRDAITPKPATPPTAVSASSAESTASFVARLEGNRAATPPAGSSLSI